MKPKPFNLIFREIQKSASQNASGFTNFDHVETQSHPIPNKATNNH